MRPTPVVIQKGSDVRVLMVGGRSDRSSQLWSSKQGKWLLSPKLPIGHNLTTFLAVKYKDEAIFTFTQDSINTITSAYLNLIDATWTSQNVENQQEMPWALKLSQ